MYQYYGIWWEYKSSTRSGYIAPDPDPQLLRYPSGT